MKRITILGALLLLACALTAHAAVHTLTGKVTDSSGALVNGTYDVVIQIYAVSTGGTALWTEYHPSVSFSGGYFTIDVGSLTVGGIPDSYIDGNHYVGVTVSNIGRGELEPRVTAIDDKATWTGFW